MAAELVSFKHLYGANSTDIIIASKYINVRRLAAGVAETETTPSGASYVVFTSDVDFYVCWNGAAATSPSADVTNGEGSELNPTERYIGGVSSFSIIADAAGSVMLAYYSE
jgi:hypothetical protein